MLLNGESFCSDAGATASIVDTGSTSTAAPCTPAFFVDAEHIHDMPTTSSTSLCMLARPQKPLGEPFFFAVFFCVSGTSRARRVETTTAGR